jgi:hypothetical protein
VTKRRVGGSDGPSPRQSFSRPPLCIPRSSCTPRFGTMEVTLRHSALILDDACQRRRAAVAIGDVVSELVSALTLGMDHRENDGSDTTKENAAVGEGFEHLAAQLNGLVIADGCAGAPSAVVTQAGSFPRLRLLRPRSSC